MRKTTFVRMLAILLISACHSTNAIQRFGLHYQKHQDYKSLYQVVELMELNVDTGYVKSILGEPIDMGFDYRYLVDSIGPKGCSIGAVFHINSLGEIGQKWIDQICE